MNSSIDTEQQLMQRASKLAGLRLGALAEALRISLPHNLLRDKGVVGQIIEKFLGATAGSLPIPDFPDLGIELKTLPINAKNQPQESTFVAMTPLVNNTGCRWENSVVRQKLVKVLWVPVEAEKHLPLAERRIGMPLLWNLMPEDEMILRQDWEELMELVVFGQLDKISAHLGTYLQIRPKAANASALCHGVNADGEKILTLPRGFYLRAAFTRKILLENYYAF